ncbi:CHAT domain-containing protein [Micromonospora sp. NPDC049151]|uniref:CHAT domain-containing protein n=1 Tax=Micromonospora sp. NPDC049151 TaxID=3155648 RepID=UPI00340C05AA
MAQVPDDALRTLVDSASAAMTTVGQADSGPWRFTRCWLRLVAFDQHGRRPDDLSAALADCDMLPEDLPGRCKLAQILVNAILRSGRFTAHLERAVALCEIAAADPHPLPEAELGAAVVRSTALARSVADSAPGVTPRGALAEVERLARVVGDRQPYAQMVEHTRVCLSFLLSALEGNPARVTESSADLERSIEFVLGLMPDREDAKVRLAAVKGFLELNVAAARGDLAAMWPALDRAEEAASSLPAAEPLRHALRAARMQMEALREMTSPANTGTAPWRSDPTGPEQHEQLAALRALAEQPGQPPHERAMHLHALGFAELAHGIDNRSLLDAAISDLRAAVDLVPDHDPRRVPYLASLGTAYLRRVEKLARRADLAEAIRLLEQGRELAGSNQHQQWTRLSNPLAHAYRMAGDKRRGREVALAGLRGHAWNVLLTGSVSDADAAARNAADDALDVAAWCLADDDPGSAALALDACRALILYTATETRDLGARLAGAGRADLAARWRDAVAETEPELVPGELRREVIAALAGIAITEDGTTTVAPDAAATRLLAPPDLDEMRAALTGLGADMLVYLMPGDEKSGAVVMVPRAEPPSWFPLATLSKQGTAGFDAFLTATTAESLAGRVAVAGSWSEAAGTARKTLDDVCDWAWTAAIGPLLERCPQPADGRAPRLVLIPVGELARIPWHAARQVTDGGVRYAIEDAVFSYAPSARLLCDLAWRAPVPLSDSGLVVGDPDTAGAAADLPAARAEAQAVRERFYPRARYVGRTPDGGAADGGVGTRADLLGWLADEHAGAMLHLACHGVVSPGRTGADTSYLLLAGGERMSAEEIVRFAPARSIALAVLAACGSGVCGRADDEAFSLSTTLLANTASAVVGAQWSVPDAATSVLMYMFHHYLRREGLAPADALRAAQRWMISDTRQVPAEMPDVLRAALGRTTTADPVGWAAFVHFGR